MTVTEAERTWADRASVAWPLWPTVLAAWVVSRVVASVVLLIAGSRTPPHPDITRLVMWDGNWYQIIAHLGYGRPPVSGQWSAWPFFPLFPGLTRLLHVAGSPYSFAMVLIANAATLLALAGVARIAVRHVSTRAAMYAVWLTALFPGALTFAMGYPDSLFLAGSVWAFVFVEERKPLAAGVAAAVAVAARPNGFVVLIALAVAILWPRRSAWSARPVTAVLGPGVAFLVAWCGVLWYHTGNPVVFLTAKSAWTEYTVLEAPVHADALVQVLLAVVFIVPFLRRIRRQPPAWIVLVALSLLPSLFLGVVGLARYAVQCFPLAIAAGQTVESIAPRARYLTIAASTAGLVAFGLLVTRASYVP
jgi:hypothetical protein